MRRAHARPRTCHRHRPRIQRGRRNRGRGALDRSVHAPASRSSSSTTARPTTPPTSSSARPRPVSGHPPGRTRASRPRSTPACEQPAHDLIVMVDGDTVFEPDAVRRLVQPFADPRSAPSRATRRWPTAAGSSDRWQHIEYVVGFNLDRRLFDVAECMPTVPGAIGAFRRDALERVGGVRDDTLAEDTDLTMALCRDGWRVVYRGGRDRVDRGAGDRRAAVEAALPVVLRHAAGDVEAPRVARPARARPASSAAAASATCSLLQVLLPLFAPVVDLFALYGLFFLDPCAVAGGVVRVPARAAAHGARTRSRSIASRRARSGRCRCSSSSTASSCTSS